MPASGRSSGGARAFAGALGPSPRENARRAAEIVGAFVGELLHRGRPAPVGVRLACERLGVTFIKMAQVVSSTYGIFPEPFVRELRRCLDDVPPFSANEARAALARAYGTPPDALFRSFEDMPLASASVAQVHRAILRDGRPVAVKVKRPGIEFRIGQDIAIARSLASPFQRRSAWAATVNLAGIIDEFERTVKDELDFRREAVFMNRYRKRVAEIDGDHIFVPRAMEELSNADVLVMDYVDGVPLTRAEEAPELDGFDLLARLMRVWCEITVKHGEYHGDLHAGNLIFVKPNRLALVDFGIVGLLDEKRRRALLDLFLFTLLDDDRLLARHFKDMGFVPEDADEAFIRVRLRETMDRGRRRPSLDIRFEDMFPEIIALARELGGSVPREVMLLSRQQVYLAAHARRLAPEKDILRHPCLSELLFPRPRMTFIPAPVKNPRYRLALPGDEPSERQLPCPVCFTVMESDTDFVVDAVFTCYACYTQLVVCRGPAQELAMVPR